MSANGLAITGLGLLTPIGFDAASTVAALDAGLARLSSIRSGTVLLEDGSEEVPQGGRIPWEHIASSYEEESWPGHDRFGLAHPPTSEEIVAPHIGQLVPHLRLAIHDAMVDAGLNVNDIQRCYLACPEDDDPRRLANELFEETGIRAITIPWGRASAVVALHTALADAAAGHDKILVMAADSQVRASVLTALAEAGRLRSGSQPSGIIPGEAVAAVVLETTASAVKRGVIPYAMVTAAAHGDEPSALDPAVTNRGEGLTKVLAEIAGQLNSQQLPWLYGDFTGEEQPFREWHVAAVRQNIAEFSAIRVCHPADRIGDSGAASGLVNLIWAAATIAAGRSQGAPALLLGISDGPTRACALVASPTAPEES